MSIRPNFYHMLQMLSTSTFVFNSYYHRNLEENSHTTDLEKNITILNHREGSTDNPVNFRPITLETVTLKILKSVLCNKVCQFLSSNRYIETNIQKGFVDGISGTFEHTSHLAYVINNTQKRQRYLIVTLLDLRNAFGEVHHNLIHYVL